MATTIIPVSGTIVAQGEILTVSTPAADPISQIYWITPNATVLVYGGVFEVGFSGSLDGGGDPYVYTFNRSAGWESSPFTIRVITAAALTTDYTFTLQAEGQYPPNMAPFNDPIEGTGTGAGEVDILDSGILQGQATDLDFNDNLTVTVDPITKVATIDGPAGGGGAGNNIALGEWAYGTSPITGGFSPVAGTFDTNSATGLSVTAIKFNAVSPALGSDAYLMLSTLPESGYLYLQDVTDPGADCIIFVVSGITLTPSVFVEFAVTPAALPEGSPFGANNYSVQYVPEAAGAAVSDFLALTDTPGSYAGEDGKIVQVSGSSLVFSDPGVIAGGEEVVGGVIFSGGVGAITAGSTGMAPVPVYGGAGNAEITITWSTAFADDQYFIQTSPVSNPFEFTVIGRGDATATIRVTDASSGVPIDVSIVPVRFDIIAQDGPSAAGGAGDITGPLSSTNNAIARWDGTLGDALQDSNVLISDTDDVSGVATLSATSTVASLEVRGEYVAMTEVAVGPTATGGRLKLWAKSTVPTTLHYRDDGGNSHAVITGASAGSDPGVFDSEAVGYVLGTNWVNTASGDTFTLADATDGSAVWNQTNGTVGGGQVDSIGPGIATTVSGTASVPVVDVTLGALATEAAAGDHGHADVTISAAGFAPTAPNDTAQFLRGDGAWGTPAIAGGGSVFALYNAINGGTTPTTGQALFNGDGTYGDVTEIRLDRYDADTSRIHQLWGRMGAGDSFFICNSDARATGSNYTITSVTPNLNQYIFVVTNGDATGSYGAQVEVWPLATGGGGGQVDSIGPGIATTVSGTASIPVVDVTLGALATEAAPGDHVHAAFTSLADGFATASGGGTVNYLRADGTWDAPGAGSGHGTTASITDHVDVDIVTDAVTEGESLVWRTDEFVPELIGGGTPAATVATSDASAGVVGTDTEYARQDHEHQIVTTGTPGTSTPGDAADAGLSDSLARVDHQHALPAFGTTGGTFGEGDAVAAAQATATDHIGDAVDAHQASAIGNDATDAGGAEVAAALDLLHNITASTGVGMWSFLDGISGTPAAGEFSTDSTNPNLVAELKINTQGFSNTGGFAFMQTLEVGDTLHFSAPSGVLIGGEPSTFTFEVNGPLVEVTGVLTFDVLSDIANGSGFDPSLKYGVALVRAGGAVAHAALVNEHIDWELASQGTIDPTNYSAAGYSDIAVFNTDIAATGHVANVTVGTTAPTSPINGDVWIDTN